MSSEARFLLNAIPIVLTFAILGGACLFAWLQGRQAEKLGVSIYTVGFLIMVGFETLTGERIPPVPTLALDTAVAMIFLVLAVVYNSLWLGSAMILQGVVLGLHAMHLNAAENVQAGHVDYYAVGNNLVSIGILVTFVFGTWASMRARRRHGRDRLAVAGVSPDSA